jgi:hypothetical protein
MSVVREGGEGGGTHESDGILMFPLPPLVAGCWRDETVVLVDLEERVV